MGVVKEDERERKTMRSYSFRTREQFPVGSDPRYIESLRSLEIGSNTRTAVGGQSRALSDDLRNACIPTISRQRSTMLCRSKQPGGTVCPIRSSHQCINSYMSSRVHVALSLSISR